MFKKLNITLLLQEVKYIPLLSLAEKQLSSITSLNKLIPILSLFILMFAFQSILGITSTLENYVIN